MRCLILLLTLLFFPFLVQAQVETLWKRVTQTHPQKIAEYLKIQETKISAVVGYGVITIEGFTSPEANVQLTSSQANLGRHQVKANKEGFFQFVNIVLPKQPGELWLRTVDSRGLSSPPVSIPEPPLGLEKIENVILPPTLAQSRGIFIEDSRSLAFGQAIPNSRIEVYFFESQNVSWFEKLLLGSPLAPKNAIAQKNTPSSFEENKLVLETDKKGFFSFDLPNQESQSFRYYVGNVFQNNFSPKSNILSFRVLSFTEALYQQIVVLASKLLALILIPIRDIVFLIFLEIIILVILIKKYQKRHVHTKPRLK